MIGRWLFAIFVLPGTVLVFVPAVILWLSTRFGDGLEMAEPASPVFWLAAIPAAAGAILALWTMSLFFRWGNGTPAPWDPPQRLVIRGPYCHVRNPMISGVVMMLVAESLFFRSWPLSLWTVFFFLANSVYFPKVEEPALRARFGAQYEIYCRNVGRWIPRVTPWHSDSSVSTDS